MNKLKDLDTLKKIVKKYKDENKKIVFTNGCFDILHLGHIRYLKEAKKLGDILIVGLNSDSSVRKLKGKNRPIFNEKERAEILSSLEFVDYVVIFDEKTPIRLIKALKPNYQVKGGDYKEEEIIEKDIVEKYGGRLVITKKIKDYSTTNIIKKLQKLTL